MTDTIRWGILATGGIAATFTEDLKLLPDAEVVAVGSRTVEGARDFASRFDIPNAHGSWTELANDDEVDVVYIANTNNAHHDAAAMMLEAGKAVLCEKPFTVNLEQARSLMTLARAKGVFLMEAMWMLCNPAIRRVSEVVASGTIGPVSTLSADFCLAGPFDPSHRLRDPKLGGGGLLDLGVYPISLAQLILGSPESISAAGHLTAEGVDATCGIVLGYESGAVSTLSCSIAADSPVRAIICGPKGRIELDEPFFRPPGFRLHRGTGNTDVEYVNVPYDGKGMLHEAMEVMRCMREGLTESPVVPWGWTSDVMSTMDEVRRQLGIEFPEKTAAA